MKMNILFLSFLLFLFSFSVEIIQNNNYNKFLSKKINEEDDLINLLEEDFLVKNESEKEEEFIPQEEEESPETDSEEENDEDENEEIDENEEENEDEGEDEGEEIGEEENKEEEPEEGENEEEEPEEKENEEDEHEEEGENEEEQSEPEPDSQRTYVNIKCLFVAKYNVYTLQKLIKKGGYQNNLKAGTVDFNFCENLDGYESTVIFEPNKTSNDNENTKIRFAGPIEGDSKNKNEWTELSEDDGTKGIKIRLAEGDKCTEDQNHLTIFKIFCDEEGNSDINEFEKSLNFTEFKPSGCVHYIMGKSIYGCALNDWYLLRKLMKEYNYIFSIVLILLGIFFAFFGKKIEKVTIVLVSGVFLSYLLTVIILNIPDLVQSEGSLLIVLGVGFVVGAFAGFMLRKKVTIFAVLIGAFAGYSVAEFVYQFIYGFITANPTVVYWVVFGICVLAGGLAGYWAVQAIIIIGTAILGGYIVMRGVTCIFDNYMELAEFADLAKNGEIEQLKDIKNGWVYAYLGLWLVISIGGIYLQCRGYKKSKSSDGKDYKKM